MKNLALVTYSELSISNDDRILVPLLEEKGLKVQVLAWDNPDVDWSRFDHIIIRTAWNYHNQLIAFLRWIDKVSLYGLFNNSELIKWNSSKNYLKELEQKGVSIIPTKWIDSLDQLEDLEIGCLVKPLIGAGSSGIVKYNGENIEDIKLLLQKSSIMIQPFLKEVTQEGEWSFVFFGNKYSHAVLRVPLQGDFRVQGQYGGQIVLQNPGKELINQAIEIYNKAEINSLYARVDGFNVEGKLLLNELELIEPALYLSLTNSAEKFAEEILNYCS